MKLKYFLRGLGTGILLTALVLCISYRLSEPKGNTVEEAKKLGMVFPEGTKPPKTEADELLEEAKSEEKKEAQATVTPKQTIASGAGVTGKESSKTTPKPTEKTQKTEKDKSKKFTVRSGLLSTSVVREMKEQGIIKDDEGLNKYLEDSGNARKIIAGTYQIPEGASFEEITKIITRQN